MKTRLFIITAIFALISFPIFAQDDITVEAETEISDNLDLKAVAALFGDAKNLEEFEKSLNDWENPVSNLDLNSDGEVDYLRVVESSEDEANIVIIQAVLEKDVFQDIATIIVPKDKTTKKIHIVGDSYIYGDNYVIEPVYVTVPVIYDWFWSPIYVSWYSPYYWGYYPSYYHHYHCIPYYSYRSWLHGFYGHHHITCHYHHRPWYDYHNSHSYRHLL